MPLPCFGLLRSSQITDLSRWRLSRDKRAFFYLFGAAFTPREAVVLGAPLRRVCEE